MEVSVASIIASLESRKVLSPDQADWALKKYKYEMSLHGNDAQARNALIEAIKKSPGQANIIDDITKTMNWRPGKPASATPTNSVGGAARVDARDNSLGQYLEAAPMLDRAWIAWGLVWTVIVLVVFTMFDPIGKYRWYGQDYMKFLTIWIGPIVGGWAAVQLLRWVARGQRDF